MMKNFIIELIDEKDDDWSQDFYRISGAVDSAWKGCNLKRDLPIAGNLKFLVGKRRALAKK